MVRRDDVRAARRRGGQVGRRIIRRGSPEWQAAIDAALARAVTAGRLPPEPPGWLLDRVADLTVLKEREDALMRRRQRGGDAQ
jgi:hypothetical protein